MDYSSFLHHQIEAIVEQYFANSNIAWIGVPDRGWLTRRQTMNGGHVVALPGFPPDDGLIWRDTKDRAELWVKPEEKADEGTGLYARAWRAFVRLVAQTEPASTLAGRELAIDHLYPETAGARLGLSFVRVLAVDRRSNSLVGSTTERAAAGPKPGSLRPRFATPFTLAKVSGFQTSLARRNNSASVARALLDHLAAQGYPIPKGALAELEIDLTASSLDWFRGDR
jgi:hypothetical protein